MHICVATTSYPRHLQDDASIFVKRLVDAIAATGTKTMVLAPSDTSSSYEQDLDGVPVSWFSYVPWGRGRVAFGAGVLPNVRRNPFLLFELALLLAKMTILIIRRRREFDVVHANWILAAFAAYIVKITVKLPYVVTLRGSDTLVFKITPLRWLCAPVLSAASNVTTVSETLANDTRGAFPSLKDKIICIQNGVEIKAATSSEIESFQNAVKINRDKKLLVAVGAVTPRKDLGTIITALPKLKDFQVAVAGVCLDHQYLRELQDLAARYQVLDRILFLGAVIPTDIPKLLGGAFAFITASKHEGRPNAVLEALALGLPVVASRIEAHSEIVADRTNGLLFEAGSADALASTVLGLETNPELYTKLQLGAKQAVAKLSTWSDAAKAFNDLFARCVSRN